MTYGLLLDISPSSSLEESVAHLTAQLRYRNYERVYYRERAATHRTALYTAQIDACSRFVSDVMEASAALGDHVKGADTIGAVRRRHPPEALVKLRERFDIDLNGSYAVVLPPPVFIAGKEYSDIFWALIGGEFPASEIDLEEHPLQAVVVRQVEVVRAIRKCLGVWSLSSDTMRRVLHRTDPARRKYIPWPFGRD